jgi:hypothetical protein
MFHGPTPVKGQTYAHVGMNAIVTPKCACLPSGHVAVRSMQGYLDTPDFAAIFRTSAS